MNNINKNFLKIWFFPHCDISEINEVSKEIEDNEYDYVLLPFKSGLPDPILKSIFVFNNTKKIGCYVAIPGYAVSAEYMVMMNKTIIDAFPNRNFMLNVIDGGIEEDLNKFNVNRDNVKNINENFVKYIKNNSNLKMSFSGISDKTIDNVDKYGEYQYIQFQDLNKINKNLYNKLILRIIICARENEEDAILYLNKGLEEIKNESFFSQEVYDRLVGNLIVGSYESVAKKIIELKDLGIAGVIVSDLALVEHDRFNVHKAMKLID